MLQESYKERFLEGTSSAGPTPLLWPIAPGNTKLFLVCRITRLACCRCCRRKSQPLEGNETACREPRIVSTGKGARLQSFRNRSPSPPSGERKQRGSLTDGPPSREITVMWKYNREGGTPTLFQSLALSRLPPLHALSNRFSYQTNLAKTAVTDSARVFHCLPECCWCFHMKNHSGLRSVTSVLVQLARTLQP